MKSYEFNNRRLVWLNNDYYIITYVNPILTTKMGEDEIYSEFKQKFNIKKHLLQTYSNNTVKVIIYVEDYVYELSIELIFGVCGILYRLYKARKAPGPPALYLSEQQGKASGLFSLRFQKIFVPLQHIYTAIIKIKP